MIGSPARRWPSPRWWAIAACGPCETTKTSAVASFARNADAIAALTLGDAQRPSGDVELAVVVRTRPAEQVARRGHALLRGLLRTADPGQLGAASSAGAAR